MTDENNDALRPTDKAVMIDMQVRTGTANVMQQRQWIRQMYSGTSLCECSVTLENGQSVSNSNEYNLVCLSTNGAVKVTFVDAEQTIHTLLVNKALILDSQVSNLIIVNEGLDPVVVNMTKLK